MCALTLANKDSDGWLWLIFLSQEFISPICPLSAFHPNNTIVGVDHIKGPFRGPLEQRRRRRPQRMKETEHHYFTPLGQCQRAPAGKWKKKKDGRPKNVLGAHFFPLLQMYLFHPFLLLINSVLQNPCVHRLTPPSLDVPESLPGSPAAVGVLRRRGGGGDWMGGGGLEDCRPLRLHLPSCFTQFLLRLLRVVASAELNGAASGLQAFF